MKLLCLILCLINFCFAQSQFKLVKLKGDLLRKHNLMTGRTGQSPTERDQAIRKIDQQLHRKLFNKPMRKYNGRSPGKKLPLDTSPLFARITDLLEDSYQDVGEAEANILLVNRDIGGGIQNYSGFNWTKPQANFQLWVDRQVVPNSVPGGFNWIVQDRQGIQISAKSLISNLVDLELIEINTTQFAAFVNLQFTRSYEYLHYANSYKEGLTSDYSKLFLPFLKFNREFALNNMEDNEIIKKKDIFHFTTGGLVTTPTWYGLSLEGGAFFDVATKHETTLYKLSPQRSKDGEFLKVSAEKSNIKVGAVQLQAQLDFFNLIKLALVTWNLSYEYDKTYKSYLEFEGEDRTFLYDDGDKRTTELDKIISNNSDKVRSLKPYLITEEEHLKETLSSEVNFLLLGKARKKGTELVKVTNNGYEKTFFKTYDSTLFFIQNFWSRLIGVIAYKLFKIETWIKRRVEIYKNFELEYEKGPAPTKPHIVEDESKFSVNLEYNITTERTHNNEDTKYKKQIIDFTKNFTDLPSGVIDNIQSNEIIGPMSLFSSIRLGKESFQFFNNLATNQAFYFLAMTCGADSINWANPMIRRQLLKSSLRYKNDRCTKSIGRLYLKYVKELNDYAYIDLIVFSKIIKYIQHNAVGISGILGLFGENNVFITGQFQGIHRPSKLPFQHYFKKGKYKGLGVIDNFVNSRD